MEEANTQEWLNPTARWLVFFDLESTCSDDPGGLVIGKGEGEAIELGAVAVDLQGEDRPRGFRTLARPVGNIEWRRLIGTGYPAIGGRVVTEDRPQRAVDCHHSVARKV